MAIQLRPKKDSTALQDQSLTINGRTFPVQPLHNQEQ
jgi:hypothetical protein